MGTHQTCHPVHAGGSLAGNDSNDASSTGSRFEGAGILRLRRRDALPNIELPSQIPSARSDNEYTHARCLGSISHERVGSFDDFDHRRAFIADRSISQRYYFYQ